MIIIIIDADIIIVAVIFLHLIAKLQIGNCYGFNMKFPLVYVCWRIGNELINIWAAKGLEGLFPHQQVSTESS